MEYFKRIEYVATTKITSFAMVGNGFTTIIRLNDSNESQVEINQVAGNQLGQDYHKIDQNEIVTAISDSIYRLVNLFDQGGII